MDNEEMKSRLQTFVERTVTMGRDVTAIQYETETKHRKMTPEEMNIVRNWRNEWIHQLRWALDLIEQDSNAVIEYNLTELLGGIFGLIVGLEEVLIMYGQQTPVVQRPTISDSEGISSPEPSEDGGSTPPGSIDVKLIRKRKEE